MTWKNRRRLLEWMYRLGLRHRPLNNIQRYQRFISVSRYGGLEVDLFGYWRTPTGRLHLEDTRRMIRSIPLNVPLDDLGRPVNQPLPGSEGQP